MFYKLLGFIVFLLFFSEMNAAVIKGNVTMIGTKFGFAEVILDYKNYTVIADEDGFFLLENVPVGRHMIKAVSSIASSEIQPIIIQNLNDTITVNIDINPEKEELENVMITGRKTYQRNTNKPVIINMLDAQMLNNLQSCNLAEGLKFQPGLRVETDCQTCNYTQLRMNGLQGSYAQMLINGRPVVSGMMMLYGLEQIPVNMLERIEVIRGAGHNMYGANAVGGTINVITKLPKKNGYELSTTYQNTGGTSSDFITNINTNWLNKKSNFGISNFINFRNRKMYDHNNDLFSELPELKNIGFGLSGFLLPSMNSKVEWNLSYLDEYRYGGDMNARKPQLALQSEERKHKVLMAGIDYQHNIIPEKSSLISYAAMSQTFKNHFTGIMPDQADEITNYMLNPPYGEALGTSYQIGSQYSHKFSQFPLGANTFILGIEYQFEKVHDQIIAYDFLIDQMSKNFFSFLQSEWLLRPKIILTSGVRVDKHNLIKKTMVNPRASLLWKATPELQFRASYGSGFKAPQAYDTDMHLSFAGGGISRVIIDHNLKQETSQNFTSSINFDRSSVDYVYGFTLEGFYTKLNEVFVLNSIGQDSIGEVFFRTNGESAVVKGLTFEVRMNIKRKIQLESGYTIQNSQYSTPIVYIENEYSGNSFLRTPNQYGFASMTWTPTSKFIANVNSVYTGPMKLTRFGGSSLYNENALINSPSFFEMNARLAYRFHLHKIEHDLEIYGGMKNVLNAYQNDFDMGKNRDSDYIYGPSIPRTIFLGFKWSY